jgi:hypothetical protein
VSDISPSGDVVYVAGEFLPPQLPGPPRFLVALSATTAAERPFSPDPRQVTAVDAFDNHVLVGTWLWDPATNETRFAADLDPRSGNLRGHAFGSASGTTKAIVHDASDIFTAGSGQALPAPARAAIVRYSTATSQPLAWGGDVAGGDVTALALTPDRLFAGGFFDHANGQPRSRLAAFERGAGNVLPFAPQLDDRSEIEDLTLARGDLVIAGVLRSLDGARRYGVGAVDATTGRARPWAPVLGPVVPPYDGGRVDDVLAYGDRLFAGGWFATVDGRPVSNLAVFRVGE